MKNTTFLLFLFCGVLHAGLTVVSTSPPAAVLPSSGTAPSETTNVNKSSSTPDSAAEKISPAPVKPPALEKPQLGQVEQKSPKKVDPPAQLTPRVQKQPRSSKPTLGDVSDKPKVDTKNQVGPEPDLVSPEERKKLLEDVAEEFYEKGNFALKEGRYQEARDLLERCLTLKSDHSAARAALATVLKSLEPTETDTVAIPQKNTTSALLKRLFAEMEASIKSKNWEKADRIAKNILAVDPINERAKNKIKGIHRQLALITAERAQAREKAGDLQGAIDAYRVAIGYYRDPAYFEKLEALAEKLGDVNNKKSEDLYLQALDASQNGNNGKALELCKEALQLNPDNIQAERMMDRLSTKSTP